MLERRQAVTADLVVDTSGRSSKLVDWLQALGYEVPEAERLMVSLGYSTRRYKIATERSANRSAELVEPASVILIEADPAHGIAGGAFGAIENGIAEMALFCAGGDRYPTTDAALYEAEVAQLHSPHIAEELQKLEPLSAPRGYRVPECLRNHFEQMTHWPSGLLVMGDAICNFDPVHGQGITVAAIEAESLASALCEQRLTPTANFERGLLGKMQEAIEAVWWLTLVADLRWPGVTYQGPLSRKGIAFAQKFFDLYLQEVYVRGNQEKFMNYFMMTALLTTPRQVINRETVKELLAAAPAQEAQALADEFFKEGDRALDRLLEEEIPLFVPLALPMPQLQH